MITLYVTDWQNGVLARRTPTRPTSAAERLTVRVDQQYQAIEGFGGAFTRAAALVWRDLPPEEQERFLRLYFDAEQGAGYTLCRTPMGGCDFAEYAYTYDDVEDDVSLQCFSIAPDLDTTLPMIRRARAMVGEAFRLYACPWSPPAWMKDTRRLEHGGRLLKAHYQTMARYFVAFLDAYREHGVPIWGLTAQNEPNEALRWPTCLYSAEEEAEFVGRYLLPTLSAHGYGDLRVMLWDNNKDLLYERVRDAMPTLEGRVWGAAFHWYTGDGFDQLDKVHSAYPALRLLATESCTPLGDPRSAGERYAHDMIGDFNHWVGGYIDWNLLLDDHGGPSYVDNRCVAPLMVRDGRLTCTEAYYAILHFSRFVKPGARRIGVRFDGAALEYTAFRNLDQSVVVVMYNPCDDPILLSFESQGICVPAHGMATAIGV